MKVLGLTGGIASGKSVVAQMFRELGAEVIDADQLAREVVEPGQPALQAIVGSFGPQILRDDGTLDRGKLAAIVFADPAARARLNAITHPPIHQRLVQAVEARRHRPGLLIAAVPLLYENGLESSVEKVVVVWVDRATQLERLMHRDRLSRAQAEQRLAAQLPLDGKRDRADDVIDNRGSLEETRRQVDAIYRRYA